MVDRAIDVVERFAKRRSVTLWGCPGTKTHPETLANRYAALVEEIPTLTVCSTIDTMFMEGSGTFSLFASRRPPTTCWRSLPLVSGEKTRGMRPQAKLACHDP
jgi:hypothetical protein